MAQLDFGNHSTLYATHGLHAFAAKCPPPLVRYALRYYSRPGELVLDPMVGSGTALVESRLMGRNALGYEIDPLAKLIAQVKTRELDDRKIETAQTMVLKHAAADLAMLASGSVPTNIRSRLTPPEFPRRDYWFDERVSTALTGLASHIRDSAMSSGVRDFLWVAFSSLILARTSVANARDIIHSRHHHYRHPEPPDVLCRFAARVTQMRKQMIQFREQCQKLSHRSNATVRQGDARRLRLQKESVDLVFTSPPYVTALDYPRAHFLAVPWMEAALGIDLETYRGNAPRYIGSQQGRLAGPPSIGGELAELNLVTSIVRRLAKASPRQAKLTERYFRDMYSVLGEISRVLRPRRHAVIVVCPSHIRKVRIPTHSAFVEMGARLGLTLKREHVRAISRKRRIMPYMSAFGPRMSTEFVLVFQKT